VRGPRAGFAEDVFANLAVDRGVAVASPVVEVEARIAGREDALRVVGIDAFRAAAVTPALIGTTDEALDLLRPDAIFLSPAAAAWLGKTVGDTLALQSGLANISVRVAGFTQAEQRQRFGVMDIAAVQDRFDRIGRITRVDLRLLAGADRDAARARLAGLLPPGVSVDPPNAGATALTRMSRAYRVNLDVLALVALFTGTLLVFSTQALAIVQRRAQFALLRTLGVTRRQLLGWLLGEGALIGAVGGVLGLAAGYALASLIVRQFGSDLGAGFFRGDAPALRLAIVPALGFVALGMLASVVGSLVPALEAARADPAPALKAGDTQRAFARLSSPAPGLVCLGLGIAATALPPFGGLPLAGYAAIALLLVGTLWLMPRVAGALLAMIPLPSGVPARMALLQLRGAPGQASVSLATIVASVSLMVAMAVMVASFRTSLDQWLAVVLPADLYVRAAAAGDSGAFSAADQQRIAAAPGIARVEFLRTQSVLLDPALPRVALLARDLPAGDPAHYLPLVDATAQVTPGDAPPLWASEAMADLHGFTVGRHVVIPIAGQMRSFVVAGIWRDYARQQGAVVIDRALYTTMTGDTAATDAALWLSPGVSIGTVRADLEQRLGNADNLTFATSGAIRDLSLRVFDRTFAVTYALEAAAVLIGLVGLSSSFGALVLARRREFGMLRHLGMTRAQIAAMLGIEGALVSAVGLAVGMALGGVTSLILIHVVNRQSFHWSMALHVPWTSLLLLGVALLTLATATTLASARRAVAIDAVRAVREDW
jgi:putative ABC transport system permease protein